jgi:hypothetical protein
MKERVTKPAIETIDSRKGIPESCSEFNKVGNIAVDFTFNDCCVVSCHGIDHRKATCKRERQEKEAK